MILLDTNVVSEMIRPTPERSVERWFAAQASADVYMCATTEAELRFGVALLPDGRRRSLLWTSGQQTGAAVQSEIRVKLKDLPEGPYPEAVWDVKVGAVWEFVLQRYGAV
jgi:predicted nucleic acid-binding protein